MIKKIKVPASKSYMARALILASLRKGKTIIKNPLFCEDSNNLINALKNLGIKFEQKNNSQITVHGLGNQLKAPQKTLNIGNSGTAIRFLIPILATQNFTSTITGNKQMQSRPMHDIIKALPGIESRNGCPPLTIHGNPNFKPKTIQINGSISSQFISGLLMAKKLFGNPKIKITGEIVSKPYIDMTKDIIKNFHTPYTIETDASSASYFFALGSVKVLNINQKSLQADIKMLKYLKKMRYKIIEDREGIQTVKPKRLKPLGKVNLIALPDSAMTLATLACFAEGKSILTGLHNLKFKETNRLHALKTELSKIGATVRELPNGLEIIGAKRLKPTTIETYNDHRMAMCAAILKSRIPGIKIKNPSCVKKTYPNFWNDYSLATS
jgi:3-phosphoshikimate 1-carboxyvinyltransferase